MIEATDSPLWVSDLAVAKKIEGKLCFCVGLPQVNKAIRPNCHPLPIVEKLTAQCIGSTVFTKLDLHQGYLQIPLALYSQNLITFLSHMGSFGFKGCLLVYNWPLAVSKKSSLLAGVPGVAK